jgi:hypothetical protein
LNVRDKPDERLLFTPHCEVNIRADEQKGVLRAHAAINHHFHCGPQPPLDKKSGTTAVCEGMARYAVLNVET